ncbi:acyl-CoA dehydrogenase [Marinobacter caseinilyticus]|uniref:acyl-CoA dehydrogenase n=1 Tax=Marinobacter caseinilyticus TaxID=2692195 RepID=UPI00140C3A60|nr:acyl-CoA dehydrogenase [Marinobacter caseinilyticus]
MEQTDQLILDTAQRLFADHCGADVVNAAESGVAPVRLLTALLEAGLPLAWVPENAGGVGGSLALGFNLIRQSAGFALAAPLAETLVANRVLAESGLEVAESWTVLVFDGGVLPMLAGGKISGLVESAPMHAGVTRLVVPVSDQGAIRIATFAPDDVEIDYRESLAGESRAQVQLSESVPLALSSAVDGMSEHGLMQFCALVRACQIAGAMEKMNELTVAYVKERQQFGRALGKFQAIQHKVADIAGESALANAAVEQAARELSEHSRPFSGSADTLLSIATAKVVASEAAGTVSRLAHQCHGAMGFSYEYPLQQYSRRIWSWREEYGSEFYWSERIGLAVADELKHSAPGQNDGRVWDIVSR